MQILRFLDPAWSEMIEASKYYNQQSEDLGVRFLNSVEAISQKILTFPESGKVLRRDIRRRLIPGWPYAVLYRIKKDQILIIAIMHQRRRPDYWYDRI